MNRVKCTPEWCGRAAPVPDGDREQVIVCIHQVGRGQRHPLPPYVVRARHPGKRREHPPQVVLGSAHPHRNTSGTHRSGGGGREAQLDIVHGEVENGDHQSSLLSLSSLLDREWSTPDDPGPLRQPARRAFRLPHHGLRGARDSRPSPRRPKLRPWPRELSATMSEVLAVGGPRSPTRSPAGRSRSRSRAEGRRQSCASAPDSTGVSSWSNARKLLPPLPW